MEATTILVLLGSAAFFVTIGWLARPELQRRSDRRGQIRLACVEAKTIVDLTTPVDHGSALPDTVMLSEITRRIHHLDRRMQELARADLPPKVSESIGDVCRVASSLAAALDAERSFRLASHDKAEAHRARSAERIAMRSYELNAAADELQWLVEAPD